MSNLSQSDRDKLDEGDFGDPKGRKFPIVDQDDVYSAAHLIGKAGNPDAVRKRIIAIAKRKKLSLPDSWKDEEDGKKGDCNMELFEIGFSTEDKETVALGDYVMRDAPLVFECKNYPDKKFSMTPEEGKAAVVEFNSRKSKEPVLLRASHKTNPLDGKLGRLVHLECDDTGKMSGKVALPRWLHEEFKGQAIPISVGFDRNRKTLTHVGLVDSPRVNGARIEAAFAAEQKNKAQREEEVFKAIATFNTEATFDTVTPHGQRRMQMMHDMSASFGALCKEDAEKDDADKDNNPAFANDRKILREVVFTSSAEHGALQAIHDSCTAAGAMCSSYDPDKVLGGRGGPPAQARYATSTEYGGEKGYTFSTNMPNTNDPAVQALQSRFVEFEKSSVEKDKKIAALEANVSLQKQENERLRQDKLKGECAEFARNLVRDNKILAYEQNNVYFELLQAGQDDHTNPVEVTFEIGAEQKKGSRLDQKKSMYNARPKHFLTEELMAGGGTPLTVLFDRAAPATDAKQHGNLFSAGEYEKLLAMTPLGQATLEKKPGIQEQRAATADKR